MYKKPPKTNALWLRKIDKEQINVQCNYAATLALIILQVLQTTAIIIIIITIIIIVIYFFIYI